MPLDADYLCEFRSLAKTGNPKTSSSDAQISLPSLPLVRLAVPHVKCPDGHVTHAFLACDEQSACWLRGYGYVESEVWGVLSTASCPAPMTSLPAMFTCSSGGQRVSYSMVCDHRPQCGDGSDESFCVFPPCSDATPMQCGTSTQVHKREGGREIEGEGGMAREWGRKERRERGVERGEGRGKEGEEGREREGEVKRGEGEREVERLSERGRDRDIEEGRERRGEYKKG